MAKIYRGILGGVEGRVGEVEGYYLNGVPLIRAKKKPGTRKNVSQAQKVSLDRMRVANTFLKPMIDFVNVGFGLSEMGRMSNGFNAAKSYLVKNCFDLSDSTYALDYSKARLTEGDLPGASNYVATRINDALKVTWTIDPDWTFFERRCQTMLLVYCPALNKATYLVSGARKSDGQDTLSIPSEFAGKEVHSYISFISDDRKSISTSVYLGN